MLGQTVLQSKNLYTSLLFGGGLYQCEGESVLDPFGSTDAVTGISPLLENVITGERFYARRLACSLVNLNRIRGQVLEPCGRDVVLWPNDVVSLPAGEVVPLSLYADNQYTEVPKGPAERMGQWALLFPFEAKPDAIRLDAVHQRLKNATWQNTKIRELAARIVLAVDRLNRCGYAYEDFHLSRFLVREDGSVYLDYSPLTYAFSDFVSDDVVELCTPKAGEYPLEFMEPSYVQGRIVSLDYNTQNYQLCALLFYLLYGRYAYDGRLLVGESDDDAMRHYVKLRNYHKMPVFIFDETDMRNALGVFAEDEEEINLWQESPASLRELFLYTLREDNALRNNRVMNPSPRTWLRVFASLGWLDGIEDLKGAFA